MTTKMMMITLMLAGMYAQAQNLDRTVMSAGGMVTDKVSCTIGEVFDFSLAKNGTVTIETGALGSAANTGGVVSTPTNVTIDKSKTPIMSVYPNPVQENLYLSLKNCKETVFLLQIFNEEGKQVLNKKLNYQQIMNCDVKHLVSGNYIVSLTYLNGKVFTSTKIVKL